MAQEENSSRSRKRKERREKRQDLKKQLHVYDLVQTRCQDQLADAVQLLDSQGIALDEFSSIDFDCKLCPMFLVCALRGNFDNHPKDWKFTWKENYKVEGRASDKD